MLGAKVVAEVVQIVKRMLNLSALYTYLSGSLSLDVAFEDLFGPGGHPEGRLDLLIVFTHQPKLNVFITKL